MIDENTEFIEALWEEGVVEWLTPFVLTKRSAQNVSKAQTAKLLEAGGQD